MPTVTVEGRSIEVAQGTKLVSAIEALGIDIGHRCGGNARCTTCRVTFNAGEPDLYTHPEWSKLQASELLGETRLSCQILVDGDMEVVALRTLQSEGWADAGPAVAAELTPATERASAAHWLSLANS
jgi:ferredoxin